jgi:hypothetical protein
LNLRPHPYQLNAGNRCADRPFCRWRSTVRAKGMRSISPLVCVLMCTTTVAAETFHCQMRARILASLLRSSLPSTCTLAFNQPYCTTPSISPRHPTYTHPSFVPLSLLSYHPNSTLESSPVRPWAGSHQALPQGPGVPSVCPVGVVGSRRLRRLDRDTGTHAPARSAMSDPAGRPS